jgi:glutamate carboxypeptidase
MHRKSMPASAALEPKLDVQSLRAFLESQMPAALELLRQMVGINSFTLNRRGLDQLARLTADAFAPLGFSAEYVPSTNPAFGNHLVLTRRGTSAHSIAMISHLDTVFPPEEEEQNDFHWQPEGDRIYGPGTQDIKGGTVMMWLVLLALQEQARDMFEQVTWKLFWNSSEEQFSPDFGDVCRSRFDPDTVAALVFETEGRISSEGLQNSDGTRGGHCSLLVVARKGRATWRVTVAGRGAHAGGKHSQGANAIVQLGKTLQYIAGLTDYKRQLTINPGTIRGGTVLNRVPHEAIAEGELRAFDAEVYAQAKTALLALNGPSEIRSVADGYACQIKVEILSESRPWPRNPGTDRLFKLWQKAAEEAGVEVSCEERGGLSDGNQLWDAVPTLDGLGPWGDNDHCSERSADGSKLPEYVEISSFVPKATLNTIAIVDLVTGANRK